MEETLVLGIGNEILTDDGIGPRLVKQLMEKMPVAGVSYMTASTGGLETLELMEGYKRLILIDALMTDDKNPGNVYCFTPSDFRDTLHLSGVHDVNFITALELGRKFDISIPEEIHIIAVEIVEDRIFSEDLSPGMKIKFELILATVMEIVRKLILR